jgi:TonB family protein
MKARKKTRPFGLRTCALAIFPTLLLFGALSLAQDSSRKVVARTAPTYPELARRMHLSGKVKLEVTITPAGSVDSAKLVGGNPVFEQSAIDAVKQWKFESAPKETKAVVVLEFAEP